MNRRAILLATFLDISQHIETMEEWTERNKSSTGKYDCSVSEKLDKSSDKKQKTGFFCEYHGPNKSNDTKDCTAVKAILQVACKSCDKKHGQIRLRPALPLLTTTRNRLALKRPERQPTVEYFQTVVTTAFKKAVEKYSAKYLAKKNGGSPMEELTTCT